MKAESIDAMILIIRVLYNILSFLRKSDLIKASQFPVFKVEHFVSSNLLINY